MLKYMGKHGSEHLKVWLRATFKTCSNHVLLMLKGFCHVFDGDVCSKRRLNAA
jgi:hypothetical protein